MSPPNSEDLVVWKPWSGMRKPQPFDFPMTGYGFQMCKQSDVLLTSSPLRGERSKGASRFLAILICHSST